MDFGENWDGFRRPFNLGCHSAATSGKCTSRLSKYAVRLPAQKGQPVRRVLVRELMVVRQACPLSQRHQTFCGTLGRTSSGVSGRLSSVNHSRATSGKHTARLYSGDGRRCSHTGQPCPRDRAATTARHSCPRGQRHQTFLDEYGMISMASGRRSGWGATARPDLDSGPAGCSQGRSCIRHKTDIPDRRPG